MAKMRTKEIIPEKTPQKRGTDSYSYEKACNKELWHTHIPFCCGRQGAGWTSS